MRRTQLVELLQRDSSFRPFRIRLSNGEEYDIDDPYYTVVAKTELHIFFPKTDRHAAISMGHIVSAEMLDFQKDEQNKNDEN
ncbi:MAG: hypothetical protein ACPGXK_15580 [Phycisphaerae bacterium]